MHIFISYAEEDFLVGIEIKKYLTANGIEVYFAKDNIQYGTDWEEGIFKALAQCEIFILLWSKNAECSKWVNLELAHASTRNKKILPITLDDTSYHGLIKKYQVAPWNKRNVAWSINQLMDALNLPSYEDTFHVSQPRTLEAAVELYKKQLIPSYSSIKIVGSDIPVSLEDIYVQLKLDDVSQEKTLSTSRETIFPHTLYNNAGKTRAIVLGHPGTGKTTLLRYITYTVAKNSNLNIPIYIRLDKRLFIYESLVEYISTYISGVAKEWAARLILDDDNFGESNTILLFDGFDELDESDQDKFITLLNKLETRYPRSNIIITSRIANFDKGQFREIGFNLYQIHQLSEIEIRNYIWDRAIPSLRVDLWQALQKNERLYSLAEIPFLLALICSAEWNLETVTDRASLFRSCTNYLLRIKDYDNDITRSREEEQNLLELQDALQAIAVHFFKLDSIGKFRFDELDFILYRLELKQSSQEIVNKIIKYSGLLQKTGNEYYFVHRSIWEYYVALGMRNENVELIMARASVSLWEEPIRLYVGLTPEKDLESTLKKLWARNKGLLLRAMTDLTNFPVELLNELVLSMAKNERVRLVFEILENVSKYPSVKESDRILLDSFSALVRVEKDCEVLYHCIVALTQRRNEACSNLVNKILDLDNTQVRLKKYLDNEVFKFEFLSIPAGQFTMGNDSANDPRERPAIQVNISEFQISKYLTTNLMYYDDFPFSLERRDGYSNKDLQPVNNVSWFEATIFAWWLGCDIPTEAQWEYACRAGGKDDEILFDTAQIPQFAWFSENSDNRTHEIGQLKPNSWDIFDMIGNVREWTIDWYSETSYNELSKLEQPIINPTGPVNGTRKVLRGGVFDWPITNLRPTYRPMNPPDNIFFGNGFRLVKHFQPE